MIPNSSLETVVAAVKNEVRFKQTVNPDIPTLVDDLVLPTTARLVDHPLLTNENLDAIAPDFDNYNYPDWDAGTVYAVSARVKFNQDIWEVNSNGPTVAGESPTTTPAKWDLIDGLSGYLEDKRNEAARNVVNSVVNKKKNERQTKEMLDHLLLYSGVGRLNDLIVKQDRAVGFRIKVLDQVNIKVILETIGLQLNSAQTAGNELTLYLYHSTRVAPIATIDIDYTNQGDVQWFDLAADNILQYEDLSDPANQLAGGAYFLMYYEEDLIGQAVNYLYNFDGGIGCNSCSKYNLNQFNKWSQFASIIPVAVANGKLDPARNMFDVEAATRQRNTNYGLNLRVSSYCDLTQYFVRHPELFADAMNRQLTVDLLRELSNTIRSNNISENVSDKARFALADTNLGGEGELLKLNKSLDALGFELSDIQQSNCMPKISSNNIHVDAIGPRNNSLSTNNGYSGFREPRSSRSR